METIIKWAIVAALVAGVLFGIVHGYELWRDAKVEEGDTQGAARVKGQWDEDIKKRDAKKLADIEAARAEERSIAAQAAQGEHDANIKAAARAASDRAAAVRAADAAGGLSSHIAALDRAARDADLPSIAACPGQLAEQRRLAITARAVVSACVAEYRSLGQDADDSLRAVQLKLDTALSYITAVAPTPVAP